MGEGPGGAGRRPYVSDTPFRTLANTNLPLPRRLPRRAPRARHEHIKLSARWPPYTSEGQEGIHQTDNNTRMSKHQTHHSSLAPHSAKFQVCTHPYACVQSTPFGGSCSIDAKEAWWGFGGHQPKQPLRGLHSRRPSPRRRRPSSFHHSPNSACQSPHHRLGRPSVHLHGWQKNGVVHGICGHYGAVSARTE